MEGWYGELLKMVHLLPGRVLLNAEVEKKNKYADACAT